MGKFGHKHCHTRWTSYEDEGQSQGHASASPERYGTRSPSKQPNLLTLDLGLLASAAKLLQSCPTLCDPIEGSPPGCPVHGILQARTLEWVAISFSNTWKWKVKVKSLSRVRPSATPWTAAFQAPPSMGFSRQEYWSGVPLPSPSSLYNCKKMISVVLSHAVRSTLLRQL